MSTSNPPCAACKYRRQKCTADCVFAPYFPPNEPEKFTNVHKVFGASNVSKILNDVAPDQRSATVASLAFEARARIREPVYGVVGHVTVLQRKLKRIQAKLFDAKQELATHIGPSAMMPMLQLPSSTGFLPPGNNNPSAGMMGYNLQDPMMGAAGPSHGGGGGGSLVVREAKPLQDSEREAQYLQHYNAAQRQQQLHQQLYEQEQQLAAMALRDEQVMIRNLDQTGQQPQQLISRFNNGFDVGNGNDIGGFDFTRYNGPAATELQQQLKQEISLEQQAHQSIHLQPKLANHEIHQNQELPYHLAHQQQDHLFMLQEQERLLMLQQPTNYPLQHQEQQPQHNLHQQHHDHNVQQQHEPRPEAEAVAEAASFPISLQQQAHQPTYRQQELAHQ